MRLSGLPNGFSGFCARGGLAWPVANVRKLKSPWRCLVPAPSFCEWTDNRPKVTQWFALDESRPLFAFAGIWRLWTGERKGETNLHLE